MGIDDNMNARLQEGRKILWTLASRLIYKNGGTTYISFGKGKYMCFIGQNVSMPMNGMNAELRKKGTG